jgi:hypothetical protein
MLKSYALHTQDQPNSTDTIAQQIFTQQNNKNA